MAGLSALGVHAETSPVIVLKVIYAALIVGVCSLGPGLMIVRRFRGWWPLERLCAAVGFSLFALYLVTAAIFGLGLGRWAYHVVSAVCLALLVFSAQDLWAMLRNIRVRRALLWFGLLLLWCLTGLSLIRHYSGGGWGGDWLEHHQRCAFFLGRFPPGQLFLEIYPLPARPPMMNLLGAFVMGQAGHEFEVFQIAFLLLNSLIFLPCALMASYLARRGGRRIALAAMLFALNPMFIQNVTYSWTKLLAGFYVVLAVWIYLRAMPRQDWGRIMLSAGCLAAGVLVHYSAAVFVVVLGVHYLVFALRKRRWKWREMLGAAATGLAILATWLVWSITVYGPKVTFASNTSVTSASIYPGWKNVEKIGSNVVHTILPHPLFRVPDRDSLFAQANHYGYWRDYTFLIYQTNLLAAMGTVSGVAILVLLIWRLWRGGVSKDMRRFWLTFVVLGFLIAVAVVGEKDYYGLAHLCLPPAILIGITFLAVNLPALPVAVRALVAAGAAVDVTLGILLQLHVENMSYRVSMDNYPLVQLIADTDPLGMSALTNVAAKAYHNLTYWGDHFGAAGIPLQVAMVLVAAAMLWGLIRMAPRPAARVPAGGETPTDTTSGSAAATPEA